MGFCSFVRRLFSCTKGFQTKMQEDTRQVKKQFCLFSKTELLQQEILQLKKRINDQLAERDALDKEIAEVAHLEQYLMSLFPKACFDQQSPTTSSSPCTDDDRSKSPNVAFLNVSGLETTPKRENSSTLQSEESEYGDEEEEEESYLSYLHDSFGNLHKEQTTTEVKEKVLDSGIQCSHQHSTCTPPMENMASKAVGTCPSQPLSYVEHMQNASTSLAEHLDTCIADHILETPNKLSEDMVKCISAIYCKLSGQPFTPSFSTISSLSSIGCSSPQDQSDMWSPGYRKDTSFSFDAKLDNPFNVEEFIEVPYIDMDNQRLTDVDDMLQSYRSLVCRLEEVDPRKMKHEEKLAFWINIHNALVMHAFLAYEIPQNNLKRVSLLLKAAYNVGGQTISADMIQTSILECRMPRPGKSWILYSPRIELKAGDDRQTYAIERTEPLVHFALCSGSHSDPAVRVYTPKRVSQELESAKEEYIRANFGARNNNQKILLPKILKSFAKDAGLCPMNHLQKNEHAKVLERKNSEEHS